MLDLSGVGVGFICLRGLTPSGASQPPKFSLTPEKIEKISQKYIADPTLFFHKSSRHTATHDRYPPSQTDILSSDPIPLGEWQAVTYRQSNLKPETREKRNPRRGETLPQDCRSFLILKRNIWCCHCWGMWDSFWQVLTIQKYSNKLMHMKFQKSKFVGLQYYYLPKHDWLDFAEIENMPKLVNPIQPTRPVLAILILFEISYLKKGAAGVEPATSRSAVECSCHWAIPPHGLTVNKYQPQSISITLFGNFWLFKTQKSNT